jgi:GNAT superfamily N-acetyltransferase
VTSADFARLQSFAHWASETTSTRVEPSRFGTALFNDDFPIRWDANYLRVDRPLKEATPNELAREVDRLYAGFGHRKTEIEDEAEGARLTAGFGQMGWESHRLVWMLHRRAPHRTSSANVREVAFSRVRPLILEIYLRTTDWGGMTPEHAEMLSDHHGYLQERLGARFFAAFVDERPVGYCELYVHGGVAQVESVNTLMEYRGRGLARAFVTRALDEAKSSGAELVFLWADEEDWPKELYRKLGFDPVAVTWEFLRPPGRDQRE